MDCCDWLWFTESIDDSGIPLLRQRTVPCRVDDHTYFTTRPIPPLRDTSLRMWLHLCLALLRPSRRVIGAQDTLSQMACSLSHDDEPQQTTAA
ncbi:MAG: hypothetical protein ETSY1_38355 [Candidatus Entotheonella factor]|uniref:Uncharacterized protein n=1 Tax=Entotheonella factor TaxID=1429438 RepID=W4L8F6_ENTF1|nr:MAG: hypothetical protein ETSY1_38355 [Candidatus Entotheonella factor]